MQTFHEPIVFEPLPMERVWGGRRMETTLAKNLPTGSPIGESWELVDREDAQSVVHGGELSGRTLHDLWTHHREAVFGPLYKDQASPRFPVLIKILDARERLSVQVHPPAALAATLNGEPKTEMWYLLDAQPAAAVYAGLKAGVSKGGFEDALYGGDVEALLHRVPVARGDSIFIPSGRLHAIAEGCLIVEVQQNSDTTYRVFDWNRVGLDGNPRDLHIEQSMMSIDFEDFEPGLDVPIGESIAACEYFHVDKWKLSAERPALEGGVFSFFAVVTGHVACGTQVFAKGEMFLVPAGFDGATVRPSGGGAELLRATIPIGEGF